MGDFRTPCAVCAVVYSNDRPGGPPSKSLPENHTKTEGRGVCSVAEARLAGPAVPFPRDDGLDDDNKDKACGREQADPCGEESGCTSLGRTATGLITEN